jgi:hypothetical protein
MRHVDIKTWIADEHVTGFRPISTVGDNAKIALCLDCGSEITVEEVTLKRALAVIEAEREQWRKRRASK